MFLNLDISNCLIQWGDLQERQNVFPIAYTTTVKVAIGGAYSWQGADTKLLSITTTYFTADKNTYATWISIGY